MNRSLSIKYWLLIANVFLVLLPLFGLIFLRLWDQHLVGVTEERLIAESTLVAEAWLQEYRREQGRADMPAPRQPRYSPRLVDDYRVLPAAPASPRQLAPTDSAAWRSGARLLSLLRAVNTREATEMHVLEAQGCAVATAGDDVGACFEHLPEVEEALLGRYAARARERAVPRSLTASDIGRSGGIRVSTALPVKLDGRVVGVVLASQRSSGPLEAVLDHRGTVAFAGVVSLSLMLAVTWFLTWAISRPVRAVTSAAEAVARGEPPTLIPPPPLAPSELAVLGRSVNRMTGLLTDRAEYIANFAAAVSHELKTPITSIGGALELLLDDESEVPPEQRRRFLENMRSATARMERLVNRLLELARIQSAPEYAEEIHVPAFFRKFAEPYGERLRLDLDDCPDRIVINPDHLDAAVRNLVENGLRHGREQPVAISVVAENGRVVISVADRGPGISAGNRARVFERFFTTERDHGGTGLGLAIVQAVAETRGGSVELATSPDGTTFTLTL